MYACVDAPGFGDLTVEDSVGETLDVLYRITIDDTGDYDVNRVNDHAIGREFRH